MVFVKIFSIHILKHAVFLLFWIFYQFENLPKHFLLPRANKRPFSPAGSSAVPRSFYCLDILFSNIIFCNVMMI